MKYLNHITLSTGHTHRSHRADVSGETLARVSPWLDALIEIGGLLPLPVSGLSAYTAMATVHDGGLIVTISGSAPITGPMAGKCPPLVTMGVAKRSRHAAALWPLLTGPVMPPAKRGIKCPDAPWLAVAIWPTIAMHPDALEWLGDFERCIAWAWITRNPDLRAA